MRIAYTKKETKNLGNYENVSVEITVEDKVDFNVETQDEAFERLSKFVISKLNLQFGTDKLKANINSTKPIITETDSDRDKIIKFYDDNIRILTKKRILELIELNPDNRLKIKQLLNRYGGNKLQELKSYDLSNFCNDLKKLKSENNEVNDIKR